MGAGRYDFFDGNGHAGHPAVDIFVCDRDHDSREDGTGRFAIVVSVCGGIVVSATRAWSRDSVDARGKVLRGGISCWIFDPVKARLYYYAHLSRLDIGAGERVDAGTPIGCIGRTGANASQPRSSTHLHFMCLSLEGPDPAPVNPRSILCGNDSVKPPR